jgi:transposase
MLADALGRPLRFHITAGQAHDITAALPLLDGRDADAVLADKAYDRRTIHFNGFVHLAAIMIWLR